MKHDWILDVLADLRTFADSNGLKALAVQLDDTRLIAATEIVSNAERTSDLADTLGEAGRGPVRAIGGRANA